jgi:NhaP-type Na+/H+ or K+/H+ antiporter
VRDLLRDSAPLLILANVGVLMATLVTGYLVHWAIGLPILIALLFGAIISATDPISVLAIFKDLRMNKRLSVVIEGESLLNDGTAVVIFQILLAGIIAGGLSVGRGIGQFLLAVVGGAVLGSVLGYAVNKITQMIDDPQIEITLTTIVAYGSYLLANHLHLSGVIATASAGLMVGNFGAKKGMSDRTRTVLESFWEYLAFVMNSLVFLLIGLEIHIDALAHAWRPVLFAIAAVLIGRSFSVYLLVPMSNFFAEKIPVRWQHVIVWGGLRGAQPRQHLSLPRSGPRSDLWGRRFFHSGTGPDNEAPAQGPGACRRPSLGLLLSHLNISVYLGSPWKEGLWLGCRGLAPKRKIAVESRANRKLHTRFQVQLRRHCPEVGLWESFTR